MDIFDVFSMLGGLALFLFGMSLMGSSLEKRAGSRLKTMLGNMTSNPLKGFLLGFVVTAIIQSSSATTVMVVGFVNSGIMSLIQATGVIIGANVGTSVTSWILSLNGIEGGTFWLKLCKPSSFVPVLALIGIILFMFTKNQKKKDTGMILLSFAILMFGMESMSDAVSGLKNVPQFAEVLTLFSNPVLGVLAGAIFTAIIQSSSASVGTLQALTVTGGITYASVIPIIMGQNIGTCITALISSVGASKNARRAAVIHLSFNVIATVVLLPLFYLADFIFDFAFVDGVANHLGIAMMHTIFNLLALSFLLPGAKLLEKISRLVIKDSKEDEKSQLLDERLLNTPSVAIARCKVITDTMAELSIASIKKAFALFSKFDSKAFEQVREDENEVDMYEDKLGSYIVKLSSHSMSEEDSAEANKILHMIGDFERISDHAVNLAASAEEIHEKKLGFSDEARKELAIMINAVDEILDLALEAFVKGNLDSAVMVEPLEQVVDYLKDNIKKQHISRLQKNECTIELGFILSDLINDLERISDHCSNIAGCVLEMAHEELDIHEYLRKVKKGDMKEYNDYYSYYMTKYSL